MNVYCLKHPHKSFCGPSETGLFHKDGVSPVALFYAETKPPSSATQSSPSMLTPQAAIDERNSSTGYQLIL